MVYVDYSPLFYCPLDERFTMDELITLVSDTLDQNNGQILYSDFLELVPFQLRSRIPQAMREMKARGIATRQNVWDANAKTVALYIQRIES